MSTQQIIDDEMFAEEDVVEIATMSIEKFNLLPLSYIDESWLHVMKHGTLLPKLSAVPRLEKKMSRLVSDRFGLSNVVESDITDSVTKQIFLSNKSDTRQFVWALGLLFHSNEIHNNIDGVTIRWLAEKLGKSSVEYSLQKRCQQLMSIESERLSIFPVDCNRHDPCEVIIRSGLKGLALFCKKYGTALNRRMMLKLPVSWAQQLKYPFFGIDENEVATILSSFFQDDQWRYLTEIGGGSPELDPVLAKCIS